MIEHAGMGVATSPFPMVNHILGSGKCPNLMGLGCACGQMVESIKGYSKRVSDQDMAYSHGLLDADMKESGKKTNGMAKERILGLIHLHLLANINRISLMDGGCSVGRMEDFMKDIGRRITAMGLELISGRMGGYFRVNSVRTAL